MTVKLGLALLGLFLLHVTHFGQATGKVSNAEITFSFPSYGINGSIKGFLSTSIVHWDDLSSSAFQGTVSVTTLKTGNFLRDWHLKGRKFFNASDFPLIEFKSSSVVAENGSMTVRGDLTMKGITKPLTIDFVKTANGLTGTALLYSSDFDIVIKPERDTNKVLIKIVLELE